MVALLRWGLIRYVYERLGLSRRAAVLILFAALLRSGINIPLMHLPAQRVVERSSTVIAINVGGAVIPIFLALHLILQHGITRRPLLALGLVTILMYHLAQPLPGVGIALPPILPSVATAVIAFAADRRNAPRTAFIAGTLGTLLGADVFNLGHIRDLGAPVASIGGAGTFDEIFMIGIVAVLLAGLPGGPKEGTPEAESRTP